MLLSSKYCRYLGVLLLQPCRLFHESFELPESFKAMREFVLLFPIHLSKRPLMSYGLAL